MTDTTCTDFDEEALHEYIGGLTLYELGNKLSYSYSETSLRYTMATPDRYKIIVLYDNAIMIIPPYEEYRPTECFYIRDGVDWNYLKSIIHRLQSQS